MRGLTFPATFETIFAFDLRNKMENSAITEDEAAVYDRQIRLWGLDAQKRLRASQILMISMKGLGAEICKNLILAGVKSVTMLDHEAVTEDDFLSQFLVAQEQYGKNRAVACLERAQQLNPLVLITADQENVTSKPDEYFLNFDVVIASCCQADVLVHINEICAANKIKFYTADVFGFYGHMFADLGNHKYVEEKQKIVNAAKVTRIKETDEPVSKKAKVEANETTLVQKFSDFCRFKDAISYKVIEGKSIKYLKRLPAAYFISQVLLRFRENHDRYPQSGTVDEDIKELIALRDAVLDELKIDRNRLADEFAGRCISEISPVCAVVGGIVAQEIIKAVSGKDAPLNNFFFFDGVEGHGTVECFTLE